MIICHSKKFIFVHIPKAAGMTITKLLMPILTKGDLVISGPSLKILDRPLISDFFEKVRLNQFPYSSILKKKFKLINLEKHSTSLEISSVVGKNIWTNYYKFSFVRNPYDRCVSAFFWMKKNQGRNLRNKNFKRLVQKISSFPDFNYFIKSVEFEQIRKENFLKPMVDYIYDSQNQLIVDYVGKFENVSKELEKLSLHFNLNNDYQTIHVNESRRKKNYRDYYTNDAQRIVKLAYDSDIRCFGYKF